MKEKMMKKSLLIVILISILFIGISCAQKQESSIFLMECNIIGLDIDFLLGGYSPERVELNLVIPFVKYLATNKNIKSIKYQINPTYFRLFLKTSNPKGEEDMYAQLNILINNLPKAPDSMNIPLKWVEEAANQTVYIAEGNSAFFKKDKFYILRKPLLLPISGMTEQKLSSLVPDIMGKRLIITYDRGRLAQFNVNYKDMRDIVLARYLTLAEGNSLLLTDSEDWKNLSLSINGIQILLKDVAKLEYRNDGINRSWTSISEFR